MDPRLSIIVCETYLKEVKYIIESEGFHDMEVDSHAADCMNCLPRDAADCHCMHIGLQLDRKASTMPRICFSALAGETLINHYLQQRAYIVTPGWLVNWKKHVIELWGFDESTAKLFFTEFSDKLVLIDSGIYDSVDFYLEEFSKFVGLEAMVIPVGIDYMKQLISNAYLKWKNDQKEALIQDKTKQLAQYAFAYEMIFEINKVVKTEEIIDKMLEMFVMLTGASDVAYLRTKDGSSEGIRTYNHKMYEGELLKGELNFSGHRINKHGTGFLLKADVGAGIVDYLELDRVAKTDRFQEYIQLSTYLFRICAFMISNRKEFYKLIKSNMQLEEDNKAKSTFFANISHELRTPINVVFSGIQLFEMLLESNSKEKLARASFHLSSMKQNCFRLLRLVNNVIDITKIESKFMKMQMQNVNFIHILEGITASVAEYAKQKQISVEFVAGEKELFAVVDVEKIDRIFFNLLSNAVKFTPAGGTIRVSVVKNENGVEISVKDSGSGIPDPMLGRIFDRFTQVENSLVKTHEGSGVGLSIVKLLVEMHQGEISVRSQQGKGSEFTVKLPFLTGSHDIAVYQEDQDRSYNLVEMLCIEFSDIYIDR